MSGSPRHVTPEPGIVGRDTERRGIAQRLHDGVPGVAAILLTGDAGIGKTALWEWALRTAIEAGDAVLVSRAGVAEARLPWVGLTDLLGGVPAAVFDALPPPQAHALQVVMLRAAPVEPLDERTVGTAMWTLLAALAELSPVAIAIDDLPYVDAASAAALRFALRRVEATARIRLVATVRGDATPPPVDGLAPDRITRIAVGPLSLGAVFELLAARLDVRLARPTLLRVHETAGGNPLYALELARALDRLEIVPAPGEPLPVPVGLDDLVDERVRSLSGDVLDIVAGTAAAWRFGADGVAPDALDRAVGAGVVLVDRTAAGTVVRSTHPLLGAAAYAALPPDRRRALHERLAARTDDDVEHARHAALAATSPTASVARLLDAGAAAALAAGTPDIAVELSRLALAHTTETVDRPPRLDALADALIRSGDTGGALEAQSEAVTLTVDGPARARRRIRAAEIMAEVDGWLACATELEIALSDAGDDTHVRAEALLTLAAVSVDIASIDGYASEAVALLDGLADPDPGILSGALAQAAGARFRAGRGLDHEAFRRSIEIERRFPTRRLSDRADASYAALLKYADDLDAAEPMLLGLLEEARASGDLSSIVYALAHLPQIGLWRGRLAEAHAYADEHLAVSEQGAMAGSVSQARYNLGWVYAYEGRLDDAERLLVESCRDVGATDFELQRAYGGLGFVALSRGDADTAAGHLDRWHALLVAMQWREPGYSRVHLDYLSALVATGRHADAAGFLDYTRELAAASGRRSTAIVAITGQALLDAVEGRLAEAQAGIDRAVAAYAESPLRFDRARTLLIAGRIHRRAKAKKLAREALDEARTQFATFGAAAWVIQTDAELSRVNLRPFAPESLTETERRIAELTAAGLTNREVASQMFLAVKTVEANLARVYRKLGIRSRAELGVRLADDPYPP